MITTTVLKITLDRPAENVWMDAKAFFESKILNAPILNL